MAENGDQLEQCFELVWARAEIERLRKITQWQPISTAPRDIVLDFWVRPLTQEDDHFVNTSGDPILASDLTQRFRCTGKYGCWSGSMKATHWRMPPGEPVPVHADPTGRNREGPHCPTCAGSGIATEIR